MGDTVEGVGSVSPEGCVSAGVGGTSKEVDAIGAVEDFCPTERGVFASGPLGAVLQGGASLDGEVLFVSGEEVEPFCFLSGKKNKHLTNYYRVIKL